MSINMVISGAAGRMGRRLIALAADDQELTCVAALEGPSCLQLQRDVGELAGIGPISIPLTQRVDCPFDVLIDFSTPEGTLRALEMCLDRGKSIVIGTTGHDESQRQAVSRASSRIPVLMAPNMSVGVNVMLKAAEMLAETLDVAYDVEITETHHRFKADAPSGTAMALRDAVCRGRSAPEPSIIYGRHGKTGARPAGEIALHSLRIGGTVGEHILAFGTLGETLSLTHVAHSRDTFAAGALRAAKWIIGRPAGLHDMQDVLFADPSTASA